MRSYAGPLVLTFFLSLFVLLMQFVWKYVDDLAGKGLEWYIVAKLLFYASAAFVPMALPLAILLASIMTFGNLGEHYELVAMKSAGISLRKVMMPLIILSIAISGFTFYFSNNIYPFANLKFKTLLFDVKQQKLTLDFKEGIFYSGIENYIIRIGKKDNDGMTVHDVLIYDLTDTRGGHNVTRAEKGKMLMTADKNHLLFTLYNGTNYLERTDVRNYRRTRPFQRTRFAEQTIQFDLLNFKLSKSDEGLFKKNYQMLNLVQLENSEDSLLAELQIRKRDFSKRMIGNFYFFSQMDSSILAAHISGDTLKGDLLKSIDASRQRMILENATNKIRNLKESSSYQIEDFEDRERTINKHRIEWHRKFTLSISCLLLFFIGAPLGAIIRKGGMGLPVVVSVIFFTIYHIINMSGEKSVKQGVAEAVVGMWIAPAILLPIGIFLTFKATTDSSLLDIESWLKVFRKIAPRKTKANENTAAVQ